ncbi:hypothetical protein KEM56_007043 [Ascosphaera pollenicola]|nr:hypothetical protein KEM56_007043 [Ascosphaera pollenicola]
MASTISALLLPATPSFGNDYHSQDPAELHAWADVSLEAMKNNYERWLTLWDASALEGTMIPSLMSQFPDFHGWNKQDSYKGRVGNAMAQSSYNMARVKSAK